MLAPGCVTTQVAGPNAVADFTIEAPELPFDSECATTEEILYLEVLKVDERLTREEIDRFAGEVRARRGIGGQVRVNEEEDGS